LDTTLKGTHPRTIPARFGVIRFSGFKGKDLNVIFYQNMPNLHNRYKSAERKISQKNPGLVWFRGFRGEDLNVKVYDGRTDNDDDGRLVMAKAHMAFGQVS
jgi:hypothetical protein